MCSIRYFESVEFITEAHSCSSSLWSHVPFPEILSSSLLGFSLLCKMWLKSVNSSLKRYLIKKHVNSVLLYLWSAFWAGKAWSEIYGEAQYISLAAAHVAFWLVRQRRVKSHEQCALRIASHGVKYCGTFMYWNMYLTSKTAARYVSTEAWLFGGLITLVAILIAIM